METQTLRAIQISTMVCNTEGYTNTVAINQHEEIEQLIEYQSGMIANLGWYSSPLETNSHVRLKPRNLMPRFLTQLLCDQEVPYAQSLGQTIAHDVHVSLANDRSLRLPVFVSVHVRIIKERRVAVHDVVSPASRGASEQVLQRLVEEQRVESVDLKEEDESCSICIESLSESQENIIKMPGCFHLFHQGCLFEWLGRQNSCPLCRSVPYEEEDEEE